MPDEQKTLWQTIKPDVAKSLIGAMFITFLSTSFAWFTWYRDKSVNRLEQNIRRIEETQSEALLITHERWYRAWRLWHELDQLKKPHAAGENSYKSVMQSYCRRELEQKREGHNCETPIVHRPDGPRPDNP